MDVLSVYRTLLTPSSCIQSILELTQLHIIVSKYKHQHMYFTKKFLIALFYRDCQHHLQLDVIVSATIFAMHASRFISPASFWLNHTSLQFFVLVHCIGWTPYYFSMEYLNCNRKGDVVQYIQFVESEQRCTWLKGQMCLLECPKCKMKRLER